MQACTLLDATPVRHLDWHTAKVTPAFKDAEKKVKARWDGQLIPASLCDFEGFLTQLRAALRYTKYWAQVRNLDCLLAHEQRRVTPLGTKVLSKSKVIGSDV